MLKVVHIDVETTGKLPQRHSIHQLAGIIEVNGTIKDRFDIKIRPLLGRIINDDALKLSGVTKSQIMRYPLFNEGLKQFLNLLSQYAELENNRDKYFLSGYGVTHFDGPFLRDLFTSTGNNTFDNWFYNVPLDSISLAAQVLRNERYNMQNFKLETVAKRFNIDVASDKLHDANYDVELHYHLYNKLSNVFP